MAGILTCSPDRGAELCRCPMQTGQKIFDYQVHSPPNVSHFAASGCITCVEEIESEAVEEPRQDSQVHRLQQKLPWDNITGHE